MNNFTVPRNPYISRSITIFSHNYTTVIQKLSTYVDNFVDKKSGKLYTSDFSGNVNVVTNESVGEWVSN